jgi:hypothetical protein
MAMNTATPVFANKLKQFDETLTISRSEESVPFRENSSSEWVQPSRESPQASSEMNEPTSPPTSFAPKQPARQDYATQEEYEEALGYWRTHIGRYLARTSTVPPAA